MTIATWNVKTMLQPGKMMEVVNESLKYRINILALQEIRWVGQGRIDKKDFTMFYSGPEKRTGLSGTGFIIDSKTRKSFMHFEPINDRISKLRIRGRFRNITFISIYAPTEDSKEEEKYKFYDQLYKECEKVPKYDMLIVLGDFNAKIGKEDFLKQIAGKYTLHDRTNENGKLLSQLASAYNLIIKSTCFNHKKIHKGTWKIPGSENVNQIDHILVSKRCSSSIIDVKSARGPNCDSDHYMVKAKIIDRLATVQNKIFHKHTKWNTDDLKGETKCQAYQQTLKSKLGKTGSEDRADIISIDEQWKSIKEAMLETARETIGEKAKIRNEEWFDDECRAIISQKNIDRLQMLQKETRSACEKYKQSRKTANKVIRNKKKAYLKKKLESIEELNSQNENRKFYHAVKRMNKGFQPRLYSCKDKNGKIIENESQVIDRWAEHF